MSLFIRSYTEEALKVPSLATITLNSVPSGDVSITPVEFRVPTFASPVTVTPVLVVVNLSVPL